MSFPQDYCYTIAGKPELLECELIDEDFADILLNEPVIYKNREFIGKSVLSDDDHLQFIKLLFLADLHVEYQSHFFGGNAPITVEFFDRWWTVTKSDAPQDVESAVRRLDATTFSSLLSTLPEAMGDRISRLRKTTGGVD